MAGGILHRAGKRRISSVSLNGQPYASYTYDEDCYGTFAKSNSVTYANGDRFERRKFNDNGCTEMAYNGSLYNSEERAADGKLLNRDCEGYT